MATVKLYVYDLSKGLARSMSMQLTGRQIDGIWHTSVVVHGLEIFYGQGILITAPGRSHHGAPVQVVDMGETAIDKDTLDEYISQMREHYTADKYHLLEFNCNSFTNDCIGFLTGGTIPSFIKDLPADFLSTPFGAALRPTIDSMFRQPISNGLHGPSPPESPLASNLLNNAAVQSTAKTPDNANVSGAATVAGPLQIATNPASLKSVLSRHQVVSVLFTSQTCPPCRIIEPVFEDLAHSKSSPGVAFVKVDIGAGLGSSTAREYSVAATPTFLFFRNGVKKLEIKGANKAELKSNIDLMIHEAFPPHPHTLKELPSIRSISLNAILFSQVPPLDSVLMKLSKSIDSTSLAQNSAEHAKHVLYTQVLPCLKAREVSKERGKPIPSIPRNLLGKWLPVTKQLCSSLGTRDIFPLVDLWRLACLDLGLCGLLAAESKVQPFDDFMGLAKKLVETECDENSSRNFYITLLKLLSNALASKELANCLLSGDFRIRMSTIIIPCLLHKDPAVRSAAASTAFNIAAHLQARLVDFHRRSTRGNPSPDAEGDGEWETEWTTALLETISQEKESEEVVHRLAAALALTLHLSCFFHDQLQPLLEVLQAKDILKAKLSDSAMKGGRIKKEQVRRLLEELSNKLL